jgi:hypothetical protein
MVMLKLGSFSVKAKVNSSLVLIKRHATKAHGVLEV